MICIKIHILSYLRKQVPLSEFFNIFPVDIEKIISIMIGADERTHIKYQGSDVENDFEQFREVMEPVFNFQAQYQDMFRGIQLRLNEIVAPFIDDIQRASELHKEVLIVSEQVVPMGDKFFKCKKRHRAIILIKCNRLKLPIIERMNFMSLHHK